MKQTSTSQRIHVRTANLGDLPRLVDIHLEAFSHHRSAKLGSAYVKRTHAWFLSDPEAISLVVERGELVVGFVAGAPEGYQRRFNAHLRPSALVNIVIRPWLLLEAGFRNAIRHRILRLFNLSASIEPDPSLYPSPLFVLLSIAVAREARGTGLAARLISAFEREVKSRRFGGVRLSMYRSNESAARAYLKSGWQLVDFFDEDAAYFVKPL